MNEFAIFLLALASGWLVYRVFSLFTASPEALMRSLGITYPLSPLVSLDAISSDSVSLHWNPSAAAGGAGGAAATVGLKKYSVYVNAELCRELDPRETSLIIRELQPDKRYSVRLLAVNEQDLASHAMPPIVFKTKYWKSEKDGPGEVPDAKAVDEASGRALDIGGNEILEPYEELAASAHTMEVTPEQEEKLKAMRQKVEESNGRVRQMKCELDRTEKSFHLAEERAEEEVEALRHQRREMEATLGKIKSEIKMYEHQKSQAEIVKSKLDRNLLETRQAAAKYDAEAETWKSRIAELAANLERAVIDLKAAEKENQEAQRKWEEDSAELNALLAKYDDENRQVRSKLREEEAANRSDGGDASEITNDTPLPGDEDWARDQVFLARTYEEKFRTYHEMQALYKATLEESLRREQQIKQQQQQQQHQHQTPPQHATYAMPQNYPASVPLPPGLMGHETNAREDRLKTSPFIGGDDIPQHRPWQDGSGDTDRHPSPAPGVGLSSEMAPKGVNVNANNLIPSHLFDGTPAAIGKGLQRSGTASPSPQAERIPSSYRESPGSADSPPQHSPRPSIQLGTPLYAGSGAPGSPLSPFSFSNSSGLLRSESRTNLDATTSGPEATSEPQNTSKRFNLFGNRSGINLFKPRNASFESPSVGSLSAMQTRSYPRKSNDLQPIGSRTRTGSASSVGAYPSSVLSHSSTEDVARPKDSKSRFISLFSGTKGPLTSKAQAGGTLFEGSTPNSSEALPLPSLTGEASRTFGWPLESGGANDANSPWHFDAKLSSSSLSNAAAAFAQKEILTPAEEEEGKSMAMAMKNNSPSTDDSPGGLSFLDRRISKESSLGSAKSNKSRLTLARRSSANRINGLFTFFKGSGSNTNNNGSNTGAGIGEHNADGVLTERPDD